LLQRGKTVRPSHCIQCETFLSYLQAGPSFFIEKSKRRMIAEDISAAFQRIK